VPPTILRAKRSARDAPSPSETVLPLTPGGKKTSLDAVPPTPAVRVLDAEGRGLGGKRVIPLVYVRSIARSSCTSMGITLPETDEELDMHFLRYTCAVNSAWWVRINLVALAIREGDGVRRDTGDQGYLALPIGELAAEPGLRPTPKRHQPPSVPRSTCCLLAPTVSSITCSRPEQESYPMLPSTIYLYAPPPPQSTRSSTARG
jgi:hypothetical protein